MNLSKLFFTVLSILCFGCSTRGQNFSYSTKTYSIEKNIKIDMKIHGNYISFYPYLFEFAIRVKQFDSVFSAGEKKSSVTFDTSNIYIIDITKKMFFEFDSFTANAKIISSGQFQDKKTGVAFKENKAIEAETGFKKDLLRDTTVFGKKLSYYSSVEKNVENADSVITQIYFLKQPNFVSVHDISNRLVKDRLYNMAGFKVHLLQQNVSISNELEEFRTLNPSEERICKGMINTMIASKKHD
jgi:hypothetical protein